jgi:hypothetical protein
MPTGNICRPVRGLGGLVIEGTFYHQPSFTGRFHWGLKDRTYFHNCVLLHIVFLSLRIFC